MTATAPPDSWSAVILTGGTGERLGGVDKAGLRLGGRTLLDRAIDCVRTVAPAASRVIVVGPPRPVTTSTSLPVDGPRFVCEEPAGGGPAAGVLAGVAATPAGTGWVLVLAVDMPGVSSETIGRLRSAADRDGAILTGADGRRHLAAYLRVAALTAHRPADPSGLPLHRLLADLELAEVPGDAAEVGDVDTWKDLRQMASLVESGRVNLHDWIDELCDSLDIDVEFDEGLVLDLARVAAHNVARPAAPITTFLLGYAAGLREASLEEQERLAAAAQRLAENWDRPAGSRDPDDVDADIPDDSTVDHTGDRFDR